LDVLFRSAPSDALK